MTYTETDKAVMDAISVMVVSVITSKDPEKALRNASLAILEAHGLNADDLLAYKSNPEEA